MNVSVCIVSYNCRDLLRSCLLSLGRDDTAADYETIVADNASTDGTVDMLREEFAHVTCLANRENRGFAAATNQTLNCARGDVRIMLNPDTEVRPGALGLLASKLASHPEIGAVGAKLRWPEGALQLTCHPFPTLWRTLVAQLGLHRAFPRTRLFGGYDMTWWSHDQPRQVDWVSGGCLAMSREAWERVGPLDEGYFMYAEEVDWCYRLRQIGLQCWYLPEAIIVHHEAATWGDAARRRVLTSHNATFRFFGKSYGRQAELLVRALVVLGSLVRGTTWTLVGALLPSKGSIVTDANLHFTVAAQALRFGDTYAPVPQDPTN